MRCGEGAIQRRRRNNQVTPAPPPAPPPAPMAGQTAGSGDGLEAIRFNWLKRTAEQRFAYGFSGCRNRLRLVRCGLLDRRTRRLFSPDFRRGRIGNWVRQRQRRLRLASLRQFRTEAEKLLDLGKFSRQLVAIHLSILQNIGHSRLPWIERNDTWTLAPSPLYWTEGSIRIIATAIWLNYVFFLHIRKTYSSMSIY